MCIRDSLSILRWYFDQPIKLFICFDHYLRSVLLYFGRTIHSSTKTCQKWNSYLELSCLGCYCSVTVLVHFRKSNRDTACLNSNYLSCLFRNRCYGDRLAFAILSFKAQWPCFSVPSGIHHSNIWSDIWLHILRRTDYLQNRCSLNCSDD